MNRERAKNLWPIIKAFAENRPIERRTIGATNWADTNQICLQLYEEKKIEYRIKPEPKYRPFKTQEECWEEMQKHQPFGWLKGKESQIYKDCCYVFDCGIFGEMFDAAYNYYTFADGTPFGIKEV